MLLLCWQQQLLIYRRPQVIRPRLRPQKNEKPFLARLANLKGAINGAVTGALLRHFHTQASILSAGNQCHHYMQAAVTLVISISQRLAQYLMQKNASVASRYTRELQSGDVLDPTLHAAPS